MHLLFDMTNSRALARHSSYTCLAALATLQFANVDTLIVPCGQNKSYSVFNNAELHSIAEAAGVHIDPGAPYNVLLREVRARVEEAEWLLFPFPTEKVVKQLAQLPPNTDRPYAFNPNAEEPDKLRTWHCEPQINRRREDSSQWVHFASGAVLAGGPADTPASPHRAAPVPRAPRAAATPRAPGEVPRNAPTGGRPKSNTSSGFVWDTADKVSEGHADKFSAEIRKEVVRLAVAAGINKSTASVQFGKWAASLQ